MSLTEFIELLKVVTWPIVALIIFFVVRPHLLKLLAATKVKLSMFGIPVEMTLAELGEVIKEQTEGKLSEQHAQYLEGLSTGDKDYPNGIDENERNLLRPIRNSGLILAKPRDAFLSQARGIQLSALWVTVPARQTWC